LTQKHRSYRGSSLVELMLTVMLIGIIVAGVSEALFVNTSWFTMLQNRLDNGLAARSFLQKLASDIRMSYQVDTTSNNSKLILLKLPATSFNQVGFFNAPLATSSSKVTYLVEPDSSTPNLFSIRYQDTATGDDRIILYGVVGPTSSTDSTAPAIFQYVSRLYPCDQSDVASSFTGGVIVNLELRRTDYGSDTGAFHKVSNGIRKKSAIALRSEFMLRNSILHGTN